MLARVGDALLHDPVDACGPTGVGDAVAVAAGRAKSTRIPASRASATSRGTSAYVGCGWLMQHAGLSSRSTPSTPRRSVSASLARVLDARRSLAQAASASRSLRKASAPACIEIWEIRWAEDVVHLARDPGAFLGPGLVDAQLLLGLGALGAVRSVQTSSRREPMYMPQPMHAVVNAMLKPKLSQTGLVVDRLRTA